MKCWFDVTLRWINCLPFYDLHIICRSFARKLASWIHNILVISNTWCGMLGWCYPEEDKLPSLLWLAQHHLMTCATPFTGLLSMLLITTQCNSITLAIAQSQLYMYMLIMLMLLKLIWPSGDRVKTEGML